MEPRPVELPAPQARSLLVSFSPRAGPRSGERRALDVAAKLESSGYRVRATSDLGELQDRAAEWHQAGDLRCVLACGGDGTAAIVRNHTPLDVPLLLLPLGTENLLGRYVSQSATPAAALETVEQGVVISLDLGRCRSETSPPRYFLTMFSAGFDAEVVRRLHERRSGNITRRAYVQPTLAAIRSYEYPEIRLYWLDDSATGSEPLGCRWVFCFNLPLYACGWQIAPQADGTDGLLDVCTFHNGSLRHVAWYLWHVMRRSHLQLADAALTRGRTLRMETPAPGQVPFQLDGDFAGMLPADVDVLAGRLRLLVMPEVARRLGFSTSGFPA
jgi:diacylglycerol kinase family enzyme